MPLNTPESNIDLDADKDVADNDGADNDDVNNCDNVIDNDIAIQGKKNFNNIFGKDFKEAFLF